MYVCMCVCVCVLFFRTIMIFHVCWCFVDSMVSGVSLFRVFVLQDLLCEFYKVEGFLTLNPKP